MQYFELTAATLKRSQEQVTLSVHSNAKNDVQIFRGK
jgi:hypothetical protein